MSFNYEEPIFLLMMYSHEKAQRKRCLMNLRSIGRIDIKTDKCDRDGDKVEKGKS